MLPVRRSCCPSWKSPLWPAEHLPSIGAASQEHRRTATAVSLSTLLTTTQVQPLDTVIRIVKPQQT